MSIKYPLVKAALAFLVVVYTQEHPPLNRLPPKSIMILQKVTLNWKIQMIKSHKTKKTMQTQNSGKHGKGSSPNLKGKCQEHRSTHGLKTPIRSLSKKEFRIGEDEWILHISRLKVLAQPVGAYADWLFNPELQMRKKGRKSEIAVLDIGMNTLDQNGNHVVTMRLTLRPGRDDELIDLVHNAPNGSLASLVREAMRTGISSKVSAFDENPDEEQFDMSGLGLEL